MRLSWHWTKLHCRTSGYVLSDMTAATARMSHVYNRLKFAPQSITSEAIFFCHASAPPATSAPGAPAERPRSRRRPALARNFSTSPFALACRKPKNRCRRRPPAPPPAPPAPRPLPPRKPPTRRGRCPLFCPPFCPVGGLWYVCNRMCCINRGVQHYTVCTGYNAHTHPLRTPFTHTLHTPSILPFISFALCALHPSSTLHTPSILHSSLCALLKPFILFIRPPH
jgi:hypothetical protein